MQAIKLVRELIHEDNKSLLFHSEIEKSITKATSEEKITATLELDITNHKDCRNTTQENDNTWEGKAPYFSLIYKEVKPNIYQGYKKD